MLLKKFHLLQVRYLIKIKELLMIDMEMKMVPNQIKVMEDLGLINTIKMILIQMIFLEPFLEIIFSNQRELIEGIHILMLEGGDNNNKINKNNSNLDMHNY